MKIRDIDKDGNVQGEYNASQHLDEAYNTGIDHATALISLKKTHLANMGYRDFEDFKKDVDYEMNQLLEYVIKLRRS